jgi:hypothetical protein
MLEFKQLFHWDRVSGCFSKKLDEIIVFQYYDCFDMGAVTRKCEAIKSADDGSDKAPQLNWKY